MPSRELPARPHLDHLRNEAKALFKQAQTGDARALQRIRDAVGDRPAVRLTDAQRVIAREYGFPTWTRLREHVQSSRGTADATDEFLAAVQMQDRERALRVLRREPRIANDSLHVSAALGLVENTTRLIRDDPSRVSARAGNPAADPLFILCASPFHGESAARDAGLLATARLLLDAGANPNTIENRYGVPALFAVTGLRSVLPIARLLLDAGANPTDGESVFHAAEHFHEEALELLLDAGADLNATGGWGNTPLYFLLRWWDVSREPRVLQGVRWLLDHGADPNVPCGREQETSLHVAARRGQSTAVVQLLLDHGANVHARRADGATAWLLARRGGHDDVAALLETAGAEAAPLSPLDLLLEACGGGDVDAARRLTSPDLRNALQTEDLLLLPDAAASGRSSTVEACLAAGFPPDTADAGGATALHHAAIHGRLAIVRALLAMGADIGIRDKEHQSTPLGWATFGVDHVHDAEGEYEGCVLALLEAGATPQEDEYRPQHEGVRAVLERFTRRRTS